MEIWQTWRNGFSPPLSMEELMPRPYSLDLRERVLKDCDAGMSSEDAARKHTVSPSWVYALRKQRRETGSIAPKKYRRGQKPKLEPYEKEIRQLVADYPDATLVELHAMLPNCENVTVPTLHNFLKRLKISWKKNALRRRATSRRRGPKTRGLEKTPNDYRPKKTRFSR